MAARNMGAVDDPEIIQDDEVPGDQVGAGAAGARLTRMLVMEARAEPEEETGRWWRRSGRLLMGPAGRWRRKGRLISQEK